MSHQVGTSIDTFKTNLNQALKIDVSIGNIGFGNIISSKWIYFYWEHDLQQTNPYGWIDVERVFLNNQYRYKHQVKLNYEPSFTT